MSPSRPHHTGPRPHLDRTVGRTVAALVVVVGLGLLSAGPVAAQLGEPVDPDDPPTTSTTEADEPTTTEADGPTTTADDGATPTTAADAGDEEPDADADAGSTDADEADDDGGTSVVALAGVGLVAFLVGLAVAGLPLLAALSRRKAATPPPPGAPAPGAPVPAPAPTGGPAFSAPPSRDADRIRGQRVALVEAVIGLRDKVPSEALAGELASALAAAGVTELRPEGERFDPAAHRAVHQVPTDDPARHGTIASVEQVGYADGTTTIRQPEVVVAVHGGSS